MGDEREIPSMSNEPPKIPPGYRQGLLTVITVFLTASILYFRYAAIEPASGRWTFWGVVFVLILGCSIFVQLFTLRRALQPDDERVSIYKVTLRWLAAGVFLLVVSFAGNMVALLAY
jgi:hypothetical protein